LNGAEYIIKFLEQKQADIIFGYPGGAVLTLYDALYKTKAIKHILTRHEQGAIHAAEGYAQATKKTGVVFATSGPGATNIVTGLADAMLDSVPVFAITGQVHMKSVGHDAFQEADMLGVTLAITKHNYLVRDIKDLPRVLEEAWQIAGTGRRGPVLVDIPNNIFAEEICKDAAHRVRYIPKERRKINAFDEQKDKIFDLLIHSYRPVILAGGGVAASKDAPELMQKFMRKYNIPCTVTLMGKSTINADIPDPLAFGMAGMHGLPAANTALSKSDLVIAVGTRFSDRTIGNPGLFSQTKSIVHADIDIAEISKNVKVNIPVVIDSAEFFRNMLGFEIPENKILQWKEWHGEILPLSSADDAPLKDKEGGKEIASKASLSEGGSKLTMREVIRTVAELCENRDNIVVTDVGQHQMIAAQETRHKTPGTFITSGGLGTMGFGLPAAIGAAFGKNSGQVILFSGDGGIQMNIQELATVRKTPVPVKIFIMDNNRLGMVRQWQEHFYGGRYSQSVLDDNPEFVTIASAYGIKGVKISSRHKLRENIQDILNCAETMLVHVLTDPEENVYPIIPAGKSNHEMLFEFEGDIL
jgi:acetolactate synthase-1/2/3 large subunit